MSLQLDPGPGREEGMQLLLRVVDPELVRALAAYPAGPAREAFALSAMRIGVLALERAQGRVDAEIVQQEGAKLVASIAELFDRNQLSLGEYFDPEKGRFPQRLRQLLREDGELASLLQAKVGSKDSELSRTLDAQLGEDSPIRKHIEAELERQRAKLLAQFTLDDEDSALSRLVRKVERAQTEICGEFSLDRETSGLSRLRSELTKLLLEARKSSAEFEKEVRETLASLETRRQEAKRTPVHGLDFEESLCACLDRIAQAQGDVAERCGHTTGRIKHCKVGDAIVTLGPDQAAQGARIVFEAKASSGYDLAKALAELETARKNRGAGVGVFALAKSCAPEGLEPLTRQGQDLVLVWDAEDPASDLVLRAGISVARALSTRAALGGAEAKADFEKIDRALRELERQVKGFDEIRRLSETIQSNAGKVLKRGGIMEKAIEAQCRELGSELAALRDARRAGDAD